MQSGLIRHCNKRAISSPATSCFHPPAANRSTATLVRRLTQSLVICLLPDGSCDRLLPASKRECVADELNLVLVARCRVFPVTQFQGYPKTVQPPIDRHVRAAATRASSGWKKDEANLARRRQIEFRDPKASTFLRARTATTRSC